MSPALFFFLIGALTCGFAVWLWWRIKAIRSWPLVLATLESATNERHTTSFKGMPVAYAVPRISYSYVVAGVTYRSSRFSVMNFTIGLPEELAPLVQGKAAGDTLNAYYNPRSPGMAVLRQPNSDAPMGLFTIGAVLCALSVVIHFN